MRFVDSLYPAIPIIFDDEYLLVVNKPSGVLSSPGKTQDGSIMTRVLESELGVQGPALVHRLDMDTSGLMLIAKQRSIHRALQQQFEQRMIRKRYRAKLERRVNVLGGRIHLPIRLDIDNRPVQIVCPEFGKASTTLWHRSHEQDACDITLYPLTGRTHQLRVHLASPLGLGIPIAGDRLYGSHSGAQQNSSSTRCVTATRLMLHADYLQFTHPHSQQRQSVTSPAPF